MAGKRGASDYLTKDGIGAMAGDDNAPVAKATAAQLANRKIKQMRQPRAGHRPVSSGASQSSGFSSPFGGNTPSNSFPPQSNGTSIVSNGSASASFGGFGSGAVGSGFNFGGTGTGNNPFASGNTQLTPGNNGSSPFNFDFGASQPAAVVAPTTTPFQFNAPPQQSAEKPAPSMFVGSSAQQPATMFGAAPNAFSSATSSSTAPSIGGFGTAAAPTTSSPFNFGAGFGAGAPARDTPLTGFGAFGASTTPSQTPFGNNLFGQPAARKSSGPSSPPASGNIFGQTSQSSAPTFGQTNDDSMQTSPETSPFKPAAAPFGWNKPNANGTPATPTKPVDESGQESPDRPPHVEQEEETPKFNPFASIPRPKNPVFAPTTPASNPFSSPVKPVEPVKDAVHEQPGAKEQTKGDNPTSSIKPLFATSTPSFFSAPVPTPDQAKSSPLYSSTPVTSGPSTNFGQQTASPSKPASSFNPSTSLFSAPKASEPSSEPTASRANPFASLARASVPSPSMPNYTQAVPASRSPPSPPSSFSELEHEIFREDNLPAPDPQRGLTEEEVRYYYQECKLRRLNVAFNNYHATQNVHTWNLIPVNNQYAALLERIENEKIGGRLTELIKEYGHVEGRRKYDQELGRSSAKGAAKRKSQTDGREEEDKRAKIDNTPSSETASKFKSFLESAASPALSTNTITATPSDSSNRFANAFIESTPSTPTRNDGLFSNAPKLASLDSTSTSTSNANPFSNAFKSNAADSATKAGVPTAAPLKVPKFGGGGSTNFMAGFAQNAKSAKELAKQKAKDEDYDSEEETEEEWEARYEQKQAEKEAALKSKPAVKFIPGKGFVSEDESGPETSAAASFLAPPPATNSLFSSRDNSPAPSTTGGGSVFDMPRSASPNLSTAGNNGNNIFGHLSDRGSDVEGSNRHDADDEDSEAGDQQETPRASNGISPTKRPPFTQEDEDEETASGVTTPTPRTDGLFGRISRDSERTPLATTEANTGGLFSFAKSTSSPSNNTWTPRDPIKFANSSNTTTNGGTAAPKPSLFSFTPIGTSKASEPQTATPPVFSGLFSGTQSAASPFGGASSAIGSFTPKVAGSTSSLFPPSGGNSVFSTPAFGSRATTPGISDMSGAESTAGEGEEVTPDAQIDLGGLSKDREGHEFLWDLPKVKASRFQKANPKSEEPDKKANQWVIAGVGPIALRKNTETGVKSLLMRQHPNGNIVLNARLDALLKPEQIKKRVKMMEYTTSGPENWIISFSSEEDSAKFLAAIESAKKS